MQARSKLIVAGYLFASLCGKQMTASEVVAVAQDDTLKKQVDEGMLAKTLGGRQFWGDVHHFRGWRIQQNVFTKHYRLIDPGDVRHMWGSFDDCAATLKKIIEQKQLKPGSGAAVVMIHGLLQSSKCMNSMGVTLRDAGYTTVNFDYPSTQISITDAAQFLDRSVQSLEGFDEINFVVHSMGGLVVRAYAMEFKDPRIKRMVMLGTPNRGAELADITQQYWIFRAAAGPGARQLGTRPDGLIPRLPAPDFEFAVIAGSRGTASGWNPLIPGDDDGTVTVASTKLNGAADFGTVRAIHSRLLRNEDAISQTVSFLKEGRLCPYRDPQPIHPEAENCHSENREPISETVPLVEAFAR
ncbi:lipase family alpha/beta hydrolase [Schlesneria paludicola]|uniref:lipase family alpha/beta hydrolase n=1 Tax=Schlesneria paludicola TaxID=360056 RepID=UPI00029A0FAC|nr:alpha/beta fold hydrolase [Schlesneria paludicola]